MPSGAPTPASVPPPNRGAVGGEASDLRILVANGDTLTEIAERYYGNAGPRVLETIRDANPWLRDPDVLWVGKLVRLPGIHAADGGRAATDTAPP
jgi:nucleoid-associated protein YgaU